MENKTLKDALERASHDPVFAQNLTENPEQYREEYQLSDEQLTMISGAGREVEGLGGAYATLDDYEPIC